jgi:hypothetical protein
MPRVAVFSTRKPLREIPSADSRDISTGQRDAIVVGSTVGSLCLLLLFSGIFYIWHFRCLKRKQKRRFLGPKRSIASFANHQLSYELPADGIVEIADRNAMKSPQELANKELFDSSRSNSSAESPPRQTARLTYYASRANSSQPTDSNCHISIQHPQQIQQDTIYGLSQSPPSALSPFQQCQNCGSPTSLRPLSDSSQHFMSEASYDPSMTSSDNPISPAGLIPEPLHITAAR